MAIEDLEDAITSAITADATFLSFGAEFASGREDKSDVFPWVEMSAPMDTRTDRTSDSLYYWRQIQFKVYAQDLETAGKITDAICNVLNDDVDLNQYVVGLHVMDVQRGNVFWNQEEDAVWCYVALFNIKYRDDRKRTPVI